MKLVTLLENTACSEVFRCAHGLSLYLETPKHKLLFDAGPNADFAVNAEKLGVDLSAVDAAILSHGHFDHAGGLETFFRANRKAKLLIHDGALGQYYALRAGDVPEYIGVDPALRAYADRFTPTDGVVKLDGELTLFDVTADSFSGMGASAGLRELRGGVMAPDAFRHEQNLLVTAQGRAVVFAGCAHRGIVNIRRRSEELLGREPDVMVGGFHLFQLTPGDPEGDALIARTGEALLPGRTVYYTGHCTGEYAYEKLKAILGDRLRRISGGMTVLL